MIKVFVVLAVTAGLFGLSRPSSASDAPQSLARPDDLKALEALAEKDHTVLIVPVFESTPEEIRRTVDDTIARGNREYDAIGRLTAGQVTFANTIEALDDIAARTDQVIGRINILQEAHPDPGMREAAFDATQKLQDWLVGVDYRADVYQAVKAFAATNPQLEGEDRRLFEDTLRDYRRAGLDLPEAKRAVVEKLRKELGPLENIFTLNINNASALVALTGEELAGVPEGLLARLKRRNDRYLVDANITFEAEAIEDNATPEATRKKVYLARDNRARARNLPLLVRILQCRSDIARELGYASWADYRTENRMARNGATALHFLENLKDRLEPKFRSELDQFRRIKAATPGQDTPDVNVWDWRFCAEKLRQQQFHVDAESLRVFFPLEKVLAGMFGVYERIFGIDIREVKAPSKYVDDLRLFAVIDRKTQEPLGLLYMDLFPRPGKFNHFANFPLVEGKLLPNGVYTRPTAELLCNFPPPDHDGLALMSHENVVTIFHEFGHAMHSILTEAKDERFSGTNVPTDFVEAPSQMLEYFAWDKNVLDGFAADYRDPARKIPAETLAELRRADLATKGTFYRRQLSFGILDLRLHSNPAPEQLAHLNDFCNGILGQVFLPPDPGTAMVASYGHLVGYDAGYYGYAWADVIAADMASVFEEAPGGYLDEKVGARLRNEIYARGNSRDITVSIEKFLGRKQSVEPFLKKVGLQ
ncbi:MAG: Zn-dependent oligopeptidase [Verrucomicrobia bacterium]|nr:Zn-dependent oligopeptidase [Verrucomicrobiota bacterium]